MSYIWLVFIYNFTAIIYQNYTKSKWRPTAILDFKIVNNFQFIKDGHTIFDFVYSEFYFKMLWVIYRFTAAGRLPAAGGRTPEAGRPPPSASGRPSPQAVGPLPAAGG